MADEFKSTNSDFEEDDLVSGGLEGRSSILLGDGLSSNGGSVASNFGSSSLMEDPIPVRGAGAAMRNVAFPNLKSEGLTETHHGLGSNHRRMRRNQKSDGRFSVGSSFMPQGAKNAAKTALRFGSRFGVSNFGIGGFGQKQSIEKSSVQDDSSSRNESKFSMSSTQARLNHSSHGIGGMASSNKYGSANLRGMSGYAKQNPYRQQYSSYSKGRLGGSGYTSAYAQQPYSKGPPSSHGLRKGPPSSHGIRTSGPPSSHGLRGPLSSHGHRQGPPSSHGLRSLNMGGGPPSSHGLRGPPSSHGLRGPPSSHGGQLRLRTPNFDFTAAGYRPSQHSRRSNAGWAGRVVREAARDLCVFVCVCQSSIRQKVKIFLCVVFHTIKYLVCPAHENFIVISPHKNAAAPRAAGWPEALSTPFTTSGRACATPDGYLHKTKIPTSHFQDSLPKLPVPELKDTMARFLASAEPLCTPQEMDEARAAVDQFMDEETGTAADLQQQVKDDDADPTTEYQNYVCGPWFDMYLKDRRPLVLNSNPSVGWKADPSKPTQLQRATSLLSSAAIFHRTLRDGHLEPDIFHTEPKKSQSGWWEKVIPWVPRKFSFYGAYAVGAYPLDMSQYELLFQSTRIPRLGCDDLQPFIGSTHVCVQRGPHFFALDVLAPDGTVLPDDVIAARLKQILEVASTNLSDLDYTNPSLPPISTLTTLDRDSWAVAREHPFRMRLMRRHSSQSTQHFVLCLGITNQTQRRLSDVTSMVMHVDGLTNHSQ